MDGIRRLEQMRRDKQIGYFACGNAVGRGPEYDAFCSIWGNPTSELIATADAPTIEQAIDRALAQLNAPPVTAPSSTEGMMMRAPG